ncbi:MAG: glycosyltransferase, partial [bacterium]|nr:glycosyltransferase [bacterium]
VHQKEKRYLKQVKGLVDDLVVVEYPMSKGVMAVLSRFYLWPFYPWEYLFVEDSRIKNKLLKFAEKISPDLVYIKRLRTLAFSQELVDLYPALLDTTDAMSLFYKGCQKMVSGKDKIIGWHEHLTYKRLEKTIGRRYPDLRWITCSQRDKNYLRKQAGIKKIWVWPNVVEVSDNPGPLSLSSRDDNSRSSWQVVFSGLMDKAINYVPALEIVDKVWPAVRQKFPKSSLLIVGPKPVKQLAKKDGLNGVKIVGFVKDLRSILKQADVYVAWGKTIAGSRNKILQALAAGLPVVAGRDSVRGLENWTGAVEVASSPEEVANGLIKVMEDNKLRQKLKRAGREWVSKKYSLAKLIEIMADDLKLKQAAYGD